MDALLMQFGKVSAAFEKGVKDAYVVAKSNSTSA